LKSLLREPCGVSTGAVAVSAGWAFSSPFAFHSPPPPRPRSSPSMVPSTSLSNVTLEPNKLSEELPAEFVLVNLKGSLSVLCGYLICQITGGSGS
jgi:hypothetical protein